MKAKYLIILLLLILLGYLVVKMLQLEDRIRRSRIVEIVKEDPNKPLMEDLSVEQLTRLAGSSVYHFVADGDYFSAYTTVLDEGVAVGRWEEVFLKGVNMGVALPGKWPGEFSATREQYLEWFIMIGEMNANTIRTYTILPPEFYHALAYYNLHYANRKLWLMQGVWAEEPPGDDYGNPGYTRTFLREIRDAVDVIHGNLVRAPKPGHAHGVYSADVSKYTIGWALGREWEPEAVATTNRNDSIDLPYGLFIDLLDGNPMEWWLAGVMEFTARYETQTYQAQRPISFINWLTLDPMYHNRELGVDDLETVDIEKFSNTTLFKPGLFASYHVYPYYPDYIFLEEKYTQTKNHRGEYDNFYAYLLDLKRHQAGMPLVIAEYGVPTSRGNSHYTPFGYHHGGYSEQEQAEIAVLMTENIHRSGCAGALWFAWIDEWFKQNWLVMELEEPLERRKNWLNVENPEQMYGVIALEPRARLIDGNPDDWGKETDKPFLEATADAAYFYLAANIPDVDFSRHNLYIAIDTHDKNRGSFKLPFRDQPLRRGVEFLVEVTGPEYANVLVDHHYSVMANHFTGERPGYQSVKNHDGMFIDQLMLSNPARVDVLGDTSEEVTHNRGLLEFGKCTDPATSNAGYYISDNGFLELRISWNALNLSDPSSRYVIDGLNPDGSVAVSETRGFHLSFFVTDKAQRPVSNFPDGRTLRFRWDKWEEPTYTARVKVAYDSLAKVFSQLEPLPAREIHDIPADHLFSLCNFYRGREGAVTIAFDGRCYSQYSNAMAMLEMYQLPATISQVYYGPEATGGTHYLQLSDNEYRALRNEGHEVRPPGPWILNPSTPDEHLVATPWRERHPFIRIRNHQQPSLHQLDTLLRKHHGTWAVMLFRHVYEPGTREHRNLLHLAGTDIDNVSPYHFEKAIRIARNTGFWVAPFHQVANYLFVYENSTLNVSGGGQRYYVTVNNNLEANYNRQPVTVEYRGPAHTIRVTGGASDGTFRVRGGRLFIDLWPNQEATLEIINP